MQPQTFYTSNQRQVENQSLPRVAGNKATNPETKVVQPKNVIPASQTAKPAQSSGLIPAPSPQTTSYNPSNPYPYYVGQVGSFDVGEYPGVKEAMGRQRQFETQYAQGQMDRGTLPNIGGYQTNLMNINAAGHAALSPIYQRQVEQAANFAGQRLGALGSAMGATAPQWQGYAGLSPITNQPIANTGTGGGGSGGLKDIATWGAGIDYATNMVKDIQDNKVGLSTARSQGQSLLQQLQNTPGYNTSAPNIWNSLKKYLQENISNPEFANLEATVNNILYTYSSVLGQNVDSLRIKGAQAPSLAAFLSNLDDLAERKINEMQRVSMSGSATSAPKYSDVQAPVAQTTPTQTMDAPTSGVTQTGLKWKIVK